MHSEDSSSIQIRSFEPRDSELCKRLYDEGHIGGANADNDTALDIDDIQNAYIAPGGAFWVAATPAGEVVGMIGVQNHEHNEGEIRRLRVRQDHRRRGIGSKLLEQAIRHCQERQYLKVKLDTFIEREPALKLFEKFRFKHSRTRQVGDKTLLYFYLDLYSGAPPQKAPEA